MQKALSNNEIVTLAIYLLGGKSESVDIEDVAMKASELAPGRFAWRKYPNHINIFTVASALSDARKAKNGRYVLGSIQKGWLLTEQGLKFAHANVDDLNQADLARKPQQINERQWQRKERVRMLADPAFAKFSTGSAGSITLQEAESFFRLNDYVVGKARERKVVRILNTFADDPELGELVKELVKRIEMR